MTKPFHPNDVLLDLLQCRVTSGALADRHECSSYQIRAIMNRHKKDGFVVSDNELEEEPYNLPV